MSENELVDLQYLLDLARDKSTEARSRLVGVLGDMFFDTSTVLTAQERDLMNDILRRLVHDVEVTVRRSLADRLSIDSHPSRELAQALANDEIDVAYPVLIRSTVLQDLDLIEIIHDRTAEHQLAITLRDDLADPVSDALVETGNEDVIVSLLENTSAQISANTIEYLVETSRRVDIFHNPLLNRQELSQDLAKRMYGWVSAALREKIVEEFKVEPGELDDLIEGTVSGLLKDHQLEGIAVPKGADLARQLSEQHAITPRLLVQTLRQGEVELFQQMFAQLSGLGVRLVRRIIFEPGGEALAVVCKAIEMDKADFASIFLRTRSARPGRRVLDPRELPRALSFFDRVAADIARRLLERLQQDSDFLFALHEVNARRNAPAA